MEVSDNQPVDFLPHWKVCGVFIEHQNQFLLLKRHPEKTHGNHWNLPAGKLEKGESPIQAALREVKEESGISLPHDEVHFLGVLYFITPGLNFEFHLFYSEVADKPNVTLAHDETIEGKWWDFSDQIHPLIPGGDEVIAFCKEKKQKLKPI
jgi:8-oxo-dGTP pyrophosphatase MutT (NUDIX family)